MTDLQTHSPDVLVPAILQRLYRYAWAPAIQLHISWWERLGFIPGHSLIQHAQFFVQQALHTFIRQKLELDRYPLPKTLESFHTLLLGSPERLHCLLVAMGLHSLKCPDYLLLKPYRQVLLTLFLPKTLAALVTLWRGGKNPPQHDPDGSLLEGALLEGIQTVQSAMGMDPIWQHVRLTLPVADRPLVASSEAAHIKTHLLRLDRFL